MKEHTLCSIDDFIPLLDLCLTEDKLDEIIISSQENIPLLQISLQVKYYYISKGSQKTIMFPIQNILKGITAVNYEHICNILELSLLVQGIENVAASSIKYLEKEICGKKQDHYIYLKLLYVIVNVYYKSKAQPPNSLQNLIESTYAEVVKSQSKSVQNLFCKLLIKYEGCTDDASSTLSFILSLNDLYTISSCFHIFKKYVSIVRSHDFWLMILDNLKLSEYYRKLSLNILKHYINFVNEYNTFNDELVIIKGTINSHTEFLKVWKDYFTLMETSQEKSLHLIVPALMLLPKVYSLHPEWIICLYNILLSHPQNSVVYFLADAIMEKKLLHNKELFANTIKCILPALNKYEYSNNLLKLFDKLKQFSMTMEDEYFNILLEESLKVNWGPVPAWYYYSSIICDKYRCKVDLLLLIKIFNHISKLPHPFIRDNSYHLLLKFFIQQYAFNNLSLNEFITIAIDLKRCDTKLLPMFYQHTEKAIQVYNENNILKEIQNIAVIEFEAVEILLEITNYNTEICTAIESVNSDINPEILDQLTSCIYKYNLEMPRITDYLNEKLQKLDNRINLRALSDIANYAKLTDLHLSRCKELLISQYSTKYQASNVTFAFMLYSNNVPNVIDKDTYHILKIWNKKLLNRDKIQNEICKCYIKIITEYLNSYHCINDEMFDVVYSIIVSIFDTQTEDVWLVIFENIEVLKCALLKHQSKDINKIIFPILDKLLSEVINFKRAENLTKAWSYLIKTILQDQAIFDNENTRDLFTDKICQISLLNDNVSYIFINELLNAPNKNLLLFIDLIISLVLYGGVYKKNKSPNYIHTNIRTVAINCIFRIVKNNAEDVTDSVARLCIQRYRKHFKKRYFPDSEIHYSKLRIVQILLSLKPHLSSECKTLLIDLIVESFCEESHQPCVKYLMQWLLVLLLRDTPTYVNKIVNKMHIVNRSQVSTIGAFAPVLCHVGFGESQEFIDLLIQIMLDWTMGAHFKLRVYSQVAICRLIEVATQKGYTKIVTRYEVFYKSIQQVLQMAGANVDNVLLTDKVFLYYFDVNKHYNLHSIFVDVPKLNKVSETEWECIDVELFSYNDLPVFGNALNIEGSVNKRNNLDDIIVDYSVNNLQKKMLPEYDLMIRDENKTKYHSELILIAALVNSAANLGGIARTCEIYGIKQLVVSDRKVLSSKEFKSLSMSSENWLEVLEVKQVNLEQYLEEIKKEGYITIGIEQTAESIKLHDYKFPKKCVIILGNEKEGIPSRIFPFLDVCLEIPQFGLLRSLNVHVAGAITVWEYVKQNTLL